MDCLPIDGVLSQISDALQVSAQLVLEAPPGAGKTTRVPWHLASRYGPGPVLVAEPRRLAAKLAATRVAEERAERLGQTVGYSVRLEHVGSSQTRVMYMTDGVLLNTLVRDPLLSEASVVILDEFHERRLQTDVCLALLLKLQATRRPDLKLVVMSATLNAAEVAAHLGGCARIRSEGRSYEVAITYQARSDDRKLPKQVASAVRQLLGSTDGDLLVFLPGAHEIRESKAALAQLLHQSDLFVAPLHGALPLEQQQAAVRRRDQRKVVLATNVAESSVTVDNISGVIDSGLARTLVHDFWSGMSQLGLVKISQASATQRAGRAGRTRDGRVIRLYTRGDLEARANSERPEIERLDLAETLLLLKSAGFTDLYCLPWLTPPPENSLNAAEMLLEDLGATAKDGSLTVVGRQLARFPVHPRLGRIIVEGEQRGVARQACLTAALLSERDIRINQQISRQSQPVSDRASDSDVLELLESYCEAERRRFDPVQLRRLELDRHVVRQVSRTYAQLNRLVRSAVASPVTDAEAEQALLIAIMTGFIDRLAQRTARSQALLLANGKTAELSQQSVVHAAPLLVAVGASERVEHGRRGRVLVRIASAVEEQWLFDMYIDRLNDSETFEFNPASERVERVSRIRFGRITLDETRLAAGPSDEVALVLLRAAESKGAHAFDPGGALYRLFVRIHVLSHYTNLVGPELLDELSSARILKAACREVTAFAELEKRGLEAVLKSLLPPDILLELERMVPESITLPFGRRVRVHYETGQDPYIESRLQDFFSMTQAPSLCDGRLPLLLHLLAPNGRAVQVTRDLAGFWERHYPALRKQLMRRYPKHAWPEDGRSATPPALKPQRSTKRQR